jgi:hypothetical protein
MESMPARATGMLDQHLDGSTVKEAPGYSPSLDLDEVIRRTLQWMQSVGMAGMAAKSPPAHRTKQALSRCFIYLACYFIYSKPSLSYFAAALS